MRVARSKEWWLAKAKSEGSSAVSAGTWQAPKPFVKWAGGKRKLVPAIREVMPKQFNYYYEPFVGGGALFFALEPKRAVLSDINLKLMNTFAGVRDDVGSVITALRKLKNNKTCYLRIRERNFECGTAAQRAAEFIYCNKIGFNGLYRVNRSGQFNVPFGRYENPTICDEDNLRAASRALQGVELLMRSFKAVEIHASAGDFVYFDPPYAPLSATSNFTAFDAEGFGDAEQTELRDVALKLKQRGVSVVLSNSSAPMIRELYSPRHWKIREVEQARAINSKSDRRGKVTELLIY